MLVVHWSKQNKTNDILANGIRPTFRKKYLDNGDIIIKSRGVYVYPYTRNKSQWGVWRRQLKTWNNILGNYNGFVFRLQEEDCPLLAGYFWVPALGPEEDRTVNSLSELQKKWGDIFSGTVINSGYEWEDFEIIIPGHISSKRIIKVLKDRTSKPNKR